MMGPFKRERTSSTPRSRPYAPRLTKVFAATVLGSVAILLPLATAQSPDPGEEDGVVTTGEPVRIDSGTFASGRTWVLRAQHSSAGLCLDVEVPERGDGGACGFELSPDNPVGYGSYVDTVAGERVVFGVALPPVDRLRFAVASSPDQWSVEAPVALAVRMETHRTSAPPEIPDQLLGDQHFFAVAASDANDIVGVRADDALGNPIFEDHWEPIDPNREYPFE
jgi:hypothetical protein